MFFRKKKRKNEIADKINDCHKRGARNLHMMIYYDKDLLFQVLPSRHFKNLVIETNDKNAYAGLHSFHKTQIKTLDELEKFKNSDLNKEHEYFLEDKNVHQFVRNLGDNPLNIQNYILDCIINIYKIENRDATWIEYIDY